MGSETGHAVMHTGAATTRPALLGVGEGMNGQNTVALGLSRNVRTPLIERTDGIGTHCEGRMSRAHSFTVCFSSDSGSF